MKEILQKIAKMWNQIVDAFLGTLFVSKAGLNLPIRSTEDLSDLT